MVVGGKGEGELLVDGFGFSGFGFGFEDSVNSSGKPVVLLGVWRSAVTRTAVMVGLLLLLLPVSPSGPFSRSLLTQRVHENVSPTYAAPKEAGRVRRGVRGDDLDAGSVEGWASVASGEMLRDGGPKVVAGRGVWVARDGRERRRTLRERECGVDD